MKLKYYLTIGAVVILLGLGFWAGWRGHSAWRPCPTITTDTIVVEDPTWHSIKNSMELTINNLQKKVDSLKAHPHIIQLPGDTIPIPADVDTVAILKDYYTKYAYTLKSENDTIAIKDSIIITQNAPVWNEFSYKIKMPFTTVINNIDNSITYSKYLQGGLYVPIYNYKADSARFNTINNVMLELTYVWPKGYFGAGWQPLTNTVGVRAGTTIFKFKKRK
jgi:hypothetical protein